MEPDDAMQRAMDAFLGGPERRDTMRPAPGLAGRDFQQLRRMLFWPSLLSLSLVCLAFLQGLASS